MQNILAEKDLIAKIKPLLPAMLSARCFSLNRLVAVTLPQVGMMKKKCDEIKIKFRKNYFAG
jgi:hypothetical protein